MDRLESGTRRVRVPGRVVVARVGDPDDSRVPMGKRNSSLVHARTHGTTPTQCSCTLVTCLCSAHDAAAYLDAKTKAQIQSPDSGAAV